MSFLAVFSLEEVHMLEIENGLEFTYYRIFKKHIQPLHSKSKTSHIKKMQKFLSINIYLF